MHLVCRYIYFFAVLRFLRLHGSANGLEPRIHYIITLTIMISMQYVKKILNILTKMLKERYWKIFSIFLFQESESRNLAATISDYLPRFRFTPTFSDLSSSKSNFYARNWSNFDQENFIIDYFTKY